MKSFNARFGAWALIFLLGSPFASTLTAQTPFTDVTATVAPGLPVVYGSSVAWGDYDNDGRLDFLIAGGGLAQVWRNTGSGFTNVTAAVAPGLPGVSAASVAWGDYDNDGRLDFLIAGFGIAQLWRNTGSGFINVTATVTPDLPQDIGATVVWVDFDNDGLLDFFIGGENVSQLWRNTGSGFENVTASVAPGLPAIYEGSVAWGDFDNDGRLDFLITGGAPGLDSNYIPISQLWRNTGSGFADVTADVAPGLTGVYHSSVAWGDFDNDGRLDFLIGGRAFGANPVCQLWRNTGNGFMNVTALAPGLPGMDSGSVSWGDFDNDGRLDFLLTGGISQLWRNTGSGFENVTATATPGLPGVFGSSAAWADYDNDGRPDFLLAGSIAQLWRNNTAVTNHAPAVITMVPSSVSRTSVVLNASIDPHHQATAAWFIWGNSSSYGQVTPVRSMGNGSSITNFSQTITGLSMGATYYYRAIGSNAQGQVVFGAEQRFVLALPSVTYVPPRGLGPTSVAFNSRANPNNIPTYGWFEWGPTPARELVTPVQFLGSGFDITLSQNLSGLEADGYYYRAVFSNSLGVVYGSAQSLVMSNTVPPETNVVCPGYLSPTSRSHGNSGGAGYTVWVNLSCTWTVINTNSWLTIISATNGVDGPGTLTYNVALNIDPQPRSGNVVIGGQILSVTQAAGHPVIITEPTDQIVFVGGTATFNVAAIGTLPFSYQWQFNTVPLTNGNGISGASSSNLVLAGVQLSQAGRYRVMVGGGSDISPSVTLTVSCGFGLSASNASFNSLSTTSSVTLSAVSTNCPWSVVNTNPWMAILSGITNIGGGKVFYSLAANPNVMARTGSVTIADQIFTIIQSGGAPTNAPISLAEALDTEGILEWDTIGTPAWFTERLISHDGVDAAQSGRIGDSAAVTALSTITGPGTLSFWWKVSSQTNKDFLKFFVEGVQQTRISGDVDWQLLSYTFPSGSYTSKWTYSKDYRTAIGNDCGWLDQVRFVPELACGATLSHSNATHSSAPETGQVNVTAAAGCAWNVINLSPWITPTMDASNGFVRYTLATNSTTKSRTGAVIIAGQFFTVSQSPEPNFALAEALDIIGTPLVVSNAGNLAWGSQSSVTHDGVDAAMGSESGSFTLNVNGPGMLVYWWKVSSQTNSNLRFNLNGFEQGRISGEVDWGQRVMNLPAGTQRLEWSFAKNADGDRCWVDQVQFFPTPQCGIFYLSPTNAALHPSISSTGYVNVWAAGACTWSSLNTNTWISILSGGSGAGNSMLYQTTMYYVVAANPTPIARSGNIRIADKIFTVTQLAGGTNQPGDCTVSISPTNRNHGYGATSNSVVVTAQNSCVWSVVNTNPWVSIRSSLTNSGSVQVSYAVSANTTAVARSGAIIIGGKQLLLTQAGASLPGTNLPRLQFMARTATYATLSVQGEPGKMYVVECSEDLVQWKPISTNSAPSTVTDAAVGNVPWRFYRTVEIP